MRAGNTDPSNTGGTLAYGENVGWINFKPASGDGVTVTAAAISGLAWGENVGWINLSPAGGGVLNDGAGRLSGFAWGENVGWINFAPDGGGVTIDEGGRFGGFAWGENVGWINFAPTGGGVTTAWKAPDLRAPVVAPPANVTVRATEVGGARGSGAAALAAFLAGGSAADVGDPSPARLSPLIGTVNADDTILFPLGASTVTFRFRDASGNVGSATSVVTVLVASDVSVTRTEIVGPLHAEQSASYTVTVRNDGPHEASGVVLTDTLTSATDFTFVSASGAACSFAAQTVTCSLGTLASGAVVPVTITVMPRGAGTLSAVAAATTDTDPALGNNSATTAPIRIVAGNIDPAETGAAFAYGENVGWINLKPAFGPGVTVRETTVTGFAWGENVGWINLSPTSGGVVNNGFGRLSGHAWGENVAWINFAPDGGGVTIDEATGNFRGFAWGENVGWINFAPSQGGVTTSWRPDRAAPTVTAPGAVTVLATAADGVSATGSAALTAFLGGGSAADTVDPAPTRLLPQVGGADVDSATVFAPGTTDVTFRFRDATGNVGTATAQVTVVPAADLSISVAAAPNPVQMRQPLTYTITVTNHGPSDATDVTLTDPVPAFATFVSASAPLAGAPVSIVNPSFESPALAEDAFTSNAIPGWTGTDSGAANNFGVYNPPTSYFTAQPPHGLNVAYIERGAISQTLATTLAAHTRYTLSVRVGKSKVDPEAGYSVQLRAGGGVLAETSSPATVTDAFVTATVTYTAPAADPQLGQPLEIRLIEHGADKTTELYFDDVSLEATFVGCSHADGHVTCNLGSLASGASVPVTIVVTPMVASLLFPFTNTVSVTSASADPNPANNGATVSTTVIASADLSVTTSVSADSAVVGLDLIYTHTVTNPGPAGAFGVVLTNTLPIGVTLVSAMPSQGSCSGTSTVTCDLVALGIGGSATVTIVVTPTTAGTKTNVASVTSSTADPDTASNSVTASTTVNSAIVVNSTLQQGSPGTAGLCTLGAAIRLANGGGPADGCTGANPSGAEDIIVVPAGTYTLTSALPEITSPITILGSGAETTVIQRAGSAPDFRLLTQFSGTLTLKGVTLRGGREEFGGAVITRNILTVEDSLLTGNNAFRNGGAVSVSGALIVRNSTFTNNSTDIGSGAAIEGHGGWTITESTFSENHAASGGGAISMCAGGMTIEDSTFSNNTAGSRAGAVRGGLFCGGPGQLTIARSLFTGNSTGDYSGAVEGGNVTITDSVFTGNHARLAGGAVSAGADGGMAVRISGSTFAGNTAGGGGAVSIYSNDIVITNSTFTDNIADTGGAISVVVGPAQLNNVTIVGNHAHQHGGGITTRWPDQTVFGNTVVAGNTAGSTPNCSDGTYVSNGHNLIGDISGCPLTPGATDVVGTAAAPIDPRLGPLADNAGRMAGAPSSRVFVQTHAPLAGSPLIDDGQPGTPGRLGGGPGATIEAWINPADVSREQPLLDSAPYLWIQPGGKLFGYAAGPGRYLESASGVLAAGVWQHVAITVDPPTGIARLYHNGAVVAEINTSLALGRPPGIAVAARPPSYFYTGLIDEVGAYSRSLTQAEIQAIVTAGSAGKCKAVPVAGCAPVPAGLLGWWPGDGSVDDLAGGSRTTLQNGATFAPGLVGQAFSFDGVNDQVSITFTACEGTDQRGVPRGTEGSICDIGAVELVVAGNHPPALTNPGSQTTPEGTTVSLAVSASDLDADTLVYSASGLPPGFTINSSTGFITGTLSFTTAGAYAVTLTVRDGKGGSASSSFTWTVTHANPPPVARALTVGTPIDTPRRITLTGGDPDGEAVTFTIVSRPAHGTLTGTPPDLVYTPAPGFRGADSFSFTASDGQRASAPATVSIRVPAHSLVVAANTPPGCSTSNNGGVFVFHVASTGLLVPLPSIPAGLVNDPSYLAFNAAGELFVANRSGCQAPSSIARFVFDGGRFVANGSISGNSLEIVHGVAFSRTGELFAQNLRTGLISRFVFDGQGNAIANGTIATGAVTNLALAFAPSGELFTTHSSNVVQRFRFDSATGAASPNGSFVVPGASTLHGLAFSERGDLFISDPTASVVFRFRFDGAGNPVANGTISVANGPLDVSFGPSGELFVSRHFSGGISRFLFDANGNAVANGSSPTANLGGTAVRNLALQTYDAQLQFDRANNPSTLGPWSYGYYPGALGSGFTLYDRSVSATVSGLPVYGWMLASDPDGLPQVFFNPNGSGVSDGPTVTDPVELNLHPGDLAGSSTRTVLRFTAPAADVYQISAVFSGNSVAGTTTDVHVLRNGASIFEGSVVGFGTVTTFTGSQDLAAGDRLDFAVGDRGNGFSNDSTGLRVTITASRPLNLPPVARPLDVTTPLNTAVDITLTGTDPNGDALTFAIASDPAHGVLTGVPPDVTYTPAPGFRGADTFTFTTNDGQVTSSPATVLIVNECLEPPAGLVAQWRANGDATDSIGANDGTLQNGAAFAPGRVGQAFSLDGVDDHVATAPRTWGFSMTGTVAAWIKTTDVASAIFALGHDGARDELFLAVDADGKAAIFNHTSPGNYVGRLSDTRVSTGEWVFVAGVLDGGGAPGNHRIFVNGVEETGSVVAAGTSTDIVDTTPRTATIGWRDAGHRIPGEAFGGLIDEVMLFDRALTAAEIRAIFVAGGLGVCAPRVPPMATAQTVTTAEDTPVAIALTGSDPSGGLLTFAVATPPAHGVLLGTPPNVSYAPGANFNGADSFTFTVTAGTLPSSAATISITVTPVNDPPFFDLIPEQRVKADGRNHAVALAGLVAGPVNEASQGLTVRAVSSNPALVPHPIVVGTGADRRLMYRPRAGAGGTATITVTADDGQLLNNLFSRMFMVTVTGRNARPTARGQSVTTAEETPIAITLVASDPDGDPLTFTILKSPLAGTLAGTAPHLTYTPRANFHGRDRFHFAVSDGAATSLTATVTVTVSPVNDPPSFDPIADQALMLGAGRQQVRIWGVSPGRGEERTQTVRMTAMSSHPAFVPHPVIKGTGARRVLGYQPAAGMTGTAIVTVTADDGQATNGTTSQTFTVTVRAPNRPPTASAQSVTTTEDGALAVTLSASDPDGDPLTFTVATAPAHGTLTGTAPDLVYTPATNFSGSDSFTFTVSDGALTSTPATVAIAVTRGLTLRFSSDITVSLGGVTVGGGEIAQDDLAGGVSRVPLESFPAGANVDAYHVLPTGEHLLSFDVTVSLPGGITAGPADVVRFDGTGYSLLFSAAAQGIPGGVNVDAVAMIGTDLVLSFDTTVSLPGGVTAGPADLVRFDGTTYTLVFNAANAGVPAGLDLDAAHVAASGRLLLSFDGSGTVGGVTFNKEDVLEFDSASGGWTLVYRGAARHAGWAGANLDALWATTNSAPVVTSLQDQTTAEGSAVSFAIAATDADGDRLSYTATGLPAGLAIDPVTGEISGSPTFTAAGTSSVTVSASDGLFSSSRTFQWQVTNVNRGPSASDASVTTVEDTPVAIALGGTDPDGEALTFMVTDGPAHGTLTGTLPNLTYTPAANFSGSDGFTFTVSDGTATSAPATVTITVTPGLTLRYSSDITVALNGVTAGGADVAQDDLAGTVTPVAIGTVPAGANVDGYHVLSDGRQLLSFDVTVSLPGEITAGPADVVRFDGTGYSVVFSAAANGIPNGVNVDAVAMVGADLLLSFDTTVSLPGGLTASPADLVRFDGVSFTLLFGGAAAGVPAGLDLDAAHYVESAGRLLLSFDGAGTVGGVTFGKEDVLELDPASGAWTLVYRGAARYAGWAGANLDALWAIPSSGGAPR